MPSHHGDAISTFDDLGAMLGLNLSGLQAPVTDGPALVTTAQSNIILTQWSSGREICGIDPVDGRFFFFNSTPGLYQTESPTSTAFVSKGLPTGFGPGRSRMVRFGAKLYLLGDNAVFISNGYVWCSRYQRPLISLGPLT